MGETIRLIFDALNRIKPPELLWIVCWEFASSHRALFDIDDNSWQLKHYPARCDATVFTLDDLTTDAQDQTAHSIAHGVNRLEELTQTYEARDGACG